MAYAIHFDRLDEQFGQLVSAVRRLLKNNDPELRIVCAEFSGTFEGLVVERRGVRVSITQRGATMEVL